MKSTIAFEAFAVQKTFSIYMQNMIAMSCFCIKQEKILYWNLENKKISGFFNIGFFCQ